MTDWISVRVDKIAHSVYGQPKNTKKKKDRESKQLRIHKNKGLSNRRFFFLIEKYLLWIKLFGQIIENCQIVLLYIKRKINSMENLFVCKLFEWK